MGSFDDGSRGWIRVIESHEKHVKIHSANANACEKLKGARQSAARS
jgi:hypothetical protein